MLKKVSAGVEWFGDRVFPLSIILTLAIWVSVFWSGAHSIGEVVLGTFFAVLASAATFWGTLLVLFVLYAAASILVECLEDIFER